jgi:DNA topoisomerase-1
MKKKYEDKLITIKMLIIVESPSKCAKIESFLSCVCISSKGHIRELKGIPEKYDAPVFETIPEKKTHIESMRKVIKKYRQEDIYVGTDDDREGEAIAWHICQVFDLPVETIKRIIFHEVTKTALEKAVLQPGIINMNIVRAQQTRQVLDMLVGYKISPVLWKYLYRNKDKSLSAGRCQTPALRLVYDNEKEKHEISQTYKITGIFYPKKIEFELTMDLKTKEDVLPFLEKSKTFLHIFSVGPKKKSEQQAPRPFHTSGLLQAASNQLHMSPKEVMSGCQQLYQDGHITYMRTDSQSYCAEYLREVQDFILGMCHKEEYVGGLDKLLNETAGNPHEAIRVTHLEMKRVEGVAARVGKLYELIWRNSVASCMSSFQTEQTPLYLTAPLDMQFVHRVEVPLFLGWKAVGRSLDITKEQEEGRALCMYVENSPKEQRCISIKSTVSIHGRHVHFSEASLIKKMEDMGIGRPSTYSSLVETIKDRGYVKKMDIEGDLLQLDEYVLEKGNILEKKVEKRLGQEKGKLVIQPMGVMVAEFLTEHFGPLFAYEYTREMEVDLDKVATEGVKRDVCGDCCKEIDELIPQISKQKFVIKDTTEYVVVFGRYGLMIQKTDGSRGTLSVRKDVDMDRLKKGEYSLGELMEKKENREIGEYDGAIIVLKSGPYGFYLEHKGEKIGVKTLTSEEEMEDEELLSAFVKKKDAEKTDMKGEGEKEEKGDEGSKKIIRELTGELSIRNGKYGAYIYYHKAGMKKPSFFALKGFKESYRFCQKEVLMDWIREKYSVG